MTLRFLSRFDFQPHWDKRYSYFAITPYLQVRRRYPHIRMGDHWISNPDSGWDFCVAWMFWSVRLSVNSPKVK